MARRPLGMTERITSKKGFIYVSLGSLLYIGLAAAFWFILAGILSVEEYGLVNYYMAVGSIGASISSLGLKTTIITFYPKDENVNFVRQAFLVTFVAGLATCLVLTVSGNFIAVFLTLAEIAFSMFVGEILGKRKYKEYALVSACSRVAQIALSLGLYLVFGIPGIFAGYALAMAIFGVRYFITLPKSRFSLQELRGKSSFVIYSYSHDLTGVLTGYFDKVLISWILGLSILGYYHLAFQVYWILAILPSALLTYLLPEKSGGAISRQVEVLGVVLAILLSAISIAFAPVIIPIVFPEFSETTILIQVMSLALVPATLISVRKAELFSRERPLNVLLANITALAVEILGLIFLPIWLGTVGLAVAIVVSQTITMIFLEIGSRRASTRRIENLN